MLTSRQLQLLQFIESHIDENGYSPTFEEMKVGLGLKSKSNMHRLLECLEQRGHIRRWRNLPRAIQVLLPSSDNRYPLPKYLVGPLKKFASEVHTTPAAVIAEAVTAYLGLEQ